MSMWGRGGGDLAIVVSRKREKVLEHWVLTHWGFTVESLLVISRERKKKWIYVPFSPSPLNTEITHSLSVADLEALTPVKCDNCTLGNNAVVSVRLVLYRSLNDGSKAVLDELGLKKTMAKNMKTCFCSIWPYRKSKKKKKDSLY